MNPKQFLTRGGIVLLVLGILGYILRDAIPFFNLTAGENLVHTLSGIVALAVVYGVKNEQTYKKLTVVFGVIALVVGVWGFFLAGGVFPNFYGLAHLDNPVDNLLHLVVGAWALYAAYGKQA